MFNNAIIPEKILNDEYGKLYFYQQDVVRKIIEEITVAEIRFHGQVILPTGSGKTRIAEYMTGKLINDIYKSYSQRTSLFGVACHRLSLANNLAERIILALVNIFRITNIKIFICNSGSYNELSSKLNNIVNGRPVFYVNNEINQLEKHIENELKIGNHVIFIMLYQSMEKLLKYKNLNFDFVFYDEAHITCEDDNYNIIEEFSKKSMINLFFTATPVIKDNHKDMTNETIYGKQIINIQPKDITETKHICPIKPVILDRIDKEGNIVTNNDTIEYTIDCIQQAADSLFKKVEKDSKNTKNGVFFVSVSGNKKLKPLLGEFGDSEQERKASENFYKWRMDNKVDLYITSSDLGGNIDFSDTPEFNKRDMDKEKFIKELMKIGKERKNKAIIINIDQLSEGIDLPDINGVMIMRDLKDNPVKILQIIGRSVRRADEDRSLIKDNSVSYLDFSKFIKPCAYVYIPTCCYSTSECNEMKDIFTMLYNSYGDIVFRIGSREKHDGTEMPLMENPDAVEKSDSKINSQKIKKQVINWEETFLDIISRFGISKTEKQKYCREKIYQLQLCDKEKFSRIYSYVQDNDISLDYLYNYILDMEK